METHLNFINQQLTHKMNYLCSGCDLMIANMVYRCIIEKTKAEKKKLIILDDVRVNSIGLEDVRNYKLFNPFNVFDMNSISNLRIILNALHFDQVKSMQVVSYFKLLLELEKLKGNRGEVTFETVIQYSSIAYVKSVIEGLNINENDRMYLFSQYSQLMAASADFEVMLYILQPMIQGKELPNQGIFWLPIYEYANDLVLREVYTLALQIYLNNHRDCELIIIDGGLGNRDYLLKLLDGLKISYHLISKDVFTLNFHNRFALLSNSFHVKIYSKHESMNSCGEIESLLGDMQVSRVTHIVTKDRHWKANRPWDVLFKRNKIDTYTKNPPVNEPKIRKEKINNLSPGEYIIEYGGQIKQGFMRK